MPLPFEGSFALGETLTVRLLRRGSGGML